MKIDDLIKELECCKSKYGNKEVLMEFDGGSARADIHGADYDTEYDSDSIIILGD